MLRKAAHPWHAAPGKGVPEEKLTPEALVSLSHHLRVAAELLLRVALPPAADTYLTVHEAEATYNLPRHWLYRNGKRHGFAVRVSQRKILFSKQRLDAYLAASQEGDYYAPQ